MHSSPRLTSFCRLNRDNTERQVLVISPNSDRVIDRQDQESSTSNSNWSIQNCWSRMLEPFNDDFTRIAVCYVGGSIAIFLIFLLFPCVGAIFQSSSSSSSTYSYTTTTSYNSRIYSRSYRSPNNVSDNSRYYSRYSSKFGYQYDQGFFINSRNRYSSDGYKTSKTVKQSFERCTLFYIIYILKPLLQFNFIRF